MGPLQLYDLTLRRLRMIHLQRPNRIKIASLRPRQQRSWNKDNHGRSVEVQSQNVDREGLGRSTPMNLGIHGLFFYFDFHIYIYIIYTYSIYNTLHIDFLLLYFFCLNHSVLIGDMGSRSRKKKINSGDFNKLYPIMNRVQRFN